MRAACTAVWAVSRSRISPSRMMLGSCRSTERSTLSKERPISWLTCIWLIRSSLYSTGSSMVTMRLVMSEMRLSMAYMLVVLPEPVGPVERTKP